ncbi:protein RIC-3 isoform 4-T4 [Ctenodactylus gundi]
MALSTVQRVALASGLVLAVSLLLPKAFLSRGKQPPQPHPAPEGYPEETYPIYDPSDCMKHRQETILVDYPDLKEPSAEEIAERMEELGEEESGRLSWENMPTDPRAQGGNSVTLHAPKPETCSCCFHEDEDPVVLAENAAFGADSFSEQEEATKEDWSQDFADEGVGNRADQTHTGGMLRKRNPQGLE